MDNKTILKHVKSILVGIRIMKNFELFDKIGSISEEIVRGNNTPFNEDYYPQYRDLNREIMFYNQNMIDKNNKYKNFFRINSEDIIFKHSIEDKRYDKDFIWIKDEVSKFLVNDVFDKNEINNIIRIGVVYTLEFEETILRKRIKTLVGDSLKNIQTFSFRFNEKKTPIESITSRKSKKNYKNIIYNFKQDENKNTTIDLDYQYFFEPRIKSMTDSNLINIIEDSNKYLLEEFNNWISSFILNNKD